MIFNRQPIFFFNTDLIKDYLPTHFDMHKIVILDLPIMNYNSYTGEVGTGKL